MNSTMLRLITGAFALGAALVLAPGANAADKKAEAFVKDAMQGNMAEIEMGKLAQQNGQSEAVKDFGKTLETDHGSANQKLQGIASQLGVQAPSEPKKKQQSEHHKLMGMTGEKFDREFAKHMVKDHKTDISKYQKASKMKEQAVAGYASETLPVLQQHLQTAQDLNKSSKGSKGRMSAR